MWKKFTQALGNFVQRILKKKSNQKVETPQEPEAEVVLFSIGSETRECTFTVDNATINVEALKVLAGEEKQTTENSQLPIEQFCPSPLYVQTLLVTTATIPQGFYTGVDLSRYDMGIAHFFMCGEEEQYAATKFDKAYLNKTLIIPNCIIYMKDGMWRWKSGYSR